MQNWLDKISKFFVDIFKSVFEGLINFFADLLTAIFTMLGDFGLWILKGLLHAIALLLKSIPAPCCVAVNGISQLINQLPPFALFVINRADVASAFHILACGVGFYLLRKLFTLGQW